MNPNDLATWAREHLAAILAEAAPSAPAIPILHVAPRVRLEGVLTFTGAETKALSCLGGERHRARDGGPCATFTLGSGSKANGIALTGTVHMELTPTWDEHSDSRSGPPAWRVTESWVRRDNHEPTTGTTRRSVDALASTYARITATPELLDQAQRVRVAGAVRDARLRALEGIRDHAEKLIEAEEMSLTRLVEAEKALAPESGGVSSRVPRARTEAVSGENSG